MDFSKLAESTHASATDRLMKDPAVKVSGSTAGGWRVDGYGSTGRGPSIRAAVSELVEKLR